MCIVLDINAFSSVFSPSSKDSKAFQPVRDWLLLGPGKLVYGGNKYKGELANVRKATKIVNILSAAGKTINLQSKTDLINQREAELNNLRLKDFDDAHLVALLDVSGCRVICTYDKRAHKFIKEPSLYKSNKPPVIYGNESLGNANKILSVKNIPKKYKPVSKLSKDRQQKLEENIKAVLFA